MTPLIQKRCYSKNISFHMDAFQIITNSYTNMLVQSVETPHASSFCLYLTLVFVGRIEFTITKMWHTANSCFLPTFYSFRLSLVIAWQMNLENMTVLRLYTNDPIIWEAIKCSMMVWKKCDFSLMLRLWTPDCGISR